MTEAVGRAANRVDQAYFLPISKENQQGKNADFQSYMFDFSCSPETKLTQEQKTRLVEHWNQWSEQGLPGEGRQGMVHALIEYLGSESRDLDLSEFASVRSCPQYLPPCIALHINVESLVLWNNIPTGMSMLTVSGKTSEPLPLGHIPSSVTGLSLENLGLTKVPAGLPEHLEVLSLKGNALEDLESLRPLLGSLQSLDVSENQLSDIPKEFLRLGPDSEVDVRNNPLSDEVLSRIEQIKNSILDGTSSENGYSNITYTLPVGF